MIKNIRVLYVAPYFTTRDGGENVLTDEVGAVVKNNQNTEFLVYAVGRGKIKCSIYKKNILYLGKPHKSIGFFLDMVKIFIKFKPDIIHSHYVIPSIFMCLFGKLFRVPCILHGRAVDINHWPYFSIKSKILFLITSKLSYAILTVSKMMKLDCIRFNIPSKKITVIYNGIDSDQFKPVNKIFFSKSDPLELLHIGSITYRKSQHLIIEACRELKNKNINFHLTLIGDGPQKQEIINLINKYDLKSYVDLLGIIDHNIVQNYIAKSDLMVFPSTTEGLPNAVLEAMSMQLPVILTRVDGHIEIAQKIGSVLIEKNNVDQIVDAIVDYFNNPENIKLGGRINRNYIIKNFSWDKHAKELFHIYNKLVKKKNFVKIKQY